MSKMNTFEDGAIMMASELIANLVEPDRIADALNTMGVNYYDCSELSDFDKRQLRKIDHEEVALVGLEYEDPNYDDA